MARSKRDLTRVRDVAVRLRGLVLTKWPSVTAFLRWTEQQDAALARTVRGWLPPEQRYTAKANGAAMRRVDWQAVHLPDPLLLRSLCSLPGMGWSEDYIYTGIGSLYRSQARGDAELEADLAVAVRAALERKSAGDITRLEFLADLELDGAELLRSAVEAASHAFDAYVQLQLDFRLQVKSAIAVARTEAIDRKGRDLSSYERLVLALEPIVTGASRLDRALPEVGELAAMFRRRNDTRTAD